MPMMAAILAAFSGPAGAQAVTGALPARIASAQQQLRAVGGLEDLSGNSEDQTEHNGEYAQNGDRVYNSHSSLPPYQTFRPLKPMKARAIRPAVTSAMGKPSKALGLSPETSSCSRTAANRKMASRKPRPPVMP